MTKPVPRPLPVTPDTHLVQLAALKDAEDGDLSDFRKLVRRGILHAKGIKSLRVMHIKRMAGAGYSTEEIKLAFVAPGSLLSPLIDELQSSGEKTFREEIAEALAECAKPDATTYRAIYIREQQRMYDACWGLVRNADSAHAKPLMELMAKFQQNIAESYGSITAQAGRRSNVQPTEVLPASAEAAAAPADETKPGAPGVDWNEEFEADDGTEDQVSDQE